MDLDNILSLSRDLALCLCKLPLSRIPFSREEIIKFMNIHLQGILSANHLQEGLITIFKKMQPNQLYLLFSRLEDCFLVFMEPTGKMLWIAGPCLTQQITPKHLSYLLKKNCTDTQTQSALENYYRSLPYIREETLLSLGRILGKQLYGEQANQWEVLSLAPERNATPELIENYEALLPMRLLEHRYEISAAFFVAVKQGNYSLAYQYYQLLLNEIITIKRKSDPFQNIQNWCSIMNSLLRHAIQQTGVHPYLLDKTVGRFSMEIESAQSQKQLEELGPQILQTYCRLVQEQLFPGCKPLIREAVAYVQGNLSAPLSVQNVSAALNVNPDYFSHLFRVETGMRFIEFLNQQRCRQAATLLNETTMPVQEIAAASGYNNISYFASQFRRQYNATPRQYRQK